MIVGRCDRVKGTSPRHHLSERLGGLLMGLIPLFLFNWQLDIAVPGQGRGLRNPWMAAMAGFLDKIMAKNLEKKFRCLEFYETSKNWIKNFIFSPSIISIKIPSSGLSRQSAASLDRNCRRLVPLVQSGNKITRPGDPARPKFMFMLILSSDSL